MNDQILYEFPLNERIRTFIRLEKLFQQVGHFSRGESEWDSRAAIESLLDILTISNRSDIRAELLKELERHYKVLARLARSHGIDREKLQEIIDEIELLSQRLRNIHGKLGSQLSRDGLFKSIAQRSAIPGGTCSFDLPCYHYWLQQPVSKRQQELHLWMEPFQPVIDAIRFVLDTIRHSALPEEAVAEAGFYQENLDKSLPFQLLRIGLNSDLPFFAEISGGKHRFSIRFMSLGPETSIHQATEDIPFLLNKCQF